MLGMAFVASAQAAFASYELKGLLVALVISVSMLAACCIADGVQFKSMFGIIGFTVLGYVVGSLVVSPVGRAYEIATGINFCTALGCITGLFWSERFYGSQKIGRSQTDYRDQLAANDDKMTN